jgi:hypothetical protein
VAWERSCVKSAQLNVSLLQRSYLKHHGVLVVYARMSMHEAVTLCVKNSNRVTDLELINVNFSALLLGIKMKWRFLVVKIFKLQFQMQ